MVKQLEINYYDVVVVSGNLSASINTNNSLKLNKNDCLSSSVKPINSCVTS